MIKNITNNITATGFTKNKVIKIKKEIKPLDKKTNFI